MSCGGDSGKIEPLTKSWEIAIPNQDVPEGLSSLSSEQCGACHQDHYQEWKMSTHAHAWTDLQFQAELKKESSPFMCINCHIPLQNQQEYIITGLIDGDIYQPVKELNPHFDKELQKEGINCASCHVRNNAVIGSFGSTKAPHKTVKDPDFLSEQLCLSCHNATAVITPTLACTFETGDEWEAGPYYGTQNCISCHMDTISRELVPGYGDRLGHLHFFAGSGIPKFDSVETNVLNGLAFYPASLKKNYSHGDTVAYSFKVKNEFAGHKVPTGDPERFFIVRFEIKNQQNEMLYEQDNRIGEKWEWYPEAKKISDNNLLPNEEREFSMSYAANEKGKFSLSIIIEKHRLDKESADYNKLGNEYPLYITIYNESFEFSVN